MVSLVAWVLRLVLVLQKLSSRQSTPCIFSTRAGNVQISVRRGGQNILEMFKMVLRICRGGYVRNFFMPPPYRCLFEGNSGGFNRQPQVKNILLLLYCWDYVLTCEPGEGGVLRGLHQVGQRLLQVARLTRTWPENQICTVNYPIRPISVRQGSCAP